MKHQLRALLVRALDAARESGALALEQTPDLRLETPREEGHGDLATNVAMVLARSERTPPREVAKRIVEHIDDREGLLDNVEVAGPGFVNFTFSPQAWRRRLVAVLQAGEAFGSGDVGRGRRVQVEFVSANPTGPLHIGHGRGAASGDALARILEATGYVVEREYYINDAGGQMETLGRSVRARYLALCGVDEPFPDDGYPGEYVTEVAAELLREHGSQWVAAPAVEAAEAMGRLAGDLLLERIRADLAAFHVRIDHYVSERELRANGTVDDAIAALEAAGCVYELEGASWFRATDFGDDKDRPLIKSDGELTYFASDVGYHRYKIERGFDRIIDVWGADHHGYVQRVRAALTALGENPDRVAVLLVQMVNLTRDGEPVRMGKRTGEFVSLREVLDEVGADLARFFFLMRKSDAHLDFDLELARRQSAENPVFYVQYAHTRIAGIFRQAAARGYPDPVPSEAAAAPLSNEDELGLIRLLDDFPNVVEAAAETFEPHRVVFYAQRLAGDFHRFYTKHKCVSDDPVVSAARLLLVKAVKLVIGRALHLVGVNAPEHM